MKIHIWNQSYLSDTNELINNFLLATDSIIWDWWVTPVTNQEDSGVGGCGGGVWPEFSQPYPWLRRPRAEFIPLATENGWKSIPWQQEMSPN